MSDKPRRQRLEEQYEFLVETAAHPDEEEDLVVVLDLLGRIRQEPKRR